MLGSNEWPLGPANRFRQLRDRSIPRGVVLGCAGCACALAHPDFDRSVNPISTRETDYANLITTGTPGFSDLPAALHPTGIIPLSFQYSMTTVFRYGVQDYSEIGKKIGELDG